MTQQEENKKHLIKVITFIVISIIAIIIVSIIINDLFFKHLEPLVYVTKTGECYHSRDCHYLKSVIEKGKNQAINEGYRACSYCHGEANGTIEVNNYLASSSIAFLIYFIGLMVWGYFMKDEEQKTDKN